MPLTLKRRGRTPLVISTMDHSALSAGIFDKFADIYRDKYMELTTYNHTYREFCELLPPSPARVLDAACGPGNVARFLMAQRPDLDLLGIDLAPHMIELARNAVPAARFAVHDCRELAVLNLHLNGLICAFGLPYLSHEEAAAFVSEAAKILEPNGIIYLSTMLGSRAESGFETCSTGDQLYINYYAEDDLLRFLTQSGFRLVKNHRMPGPSAAPKKTTDLIVIARK
jgi:ubiquinone/menaquinone biosynthesis C-methylase UbiE